MSVVNLWRMRWLRLRWLHLRCWLFGVHDWQKVEVSYDGWVTYTDCWWCNEIQAAWMRSSDEAVVIGKR